MRRPWRRPSHLQGPLQRALHQVLLHKGDVQLRLCRPAPRHAQRALDLRRGRRGRGRWRDGAAGVLLPGVWSLRVHMGPRGGGCAWVLSEGALHHATSSPGNPCLRAPRSAGPGPAF